MLGRAVVPHDQSVGHPMMAELILGNGCLLIQDFEQRLALALVHVLDADRELWIDEQHLAAGHRMHAPHWMYHRRVDRLPSQYVLPVAFGIVEKLAERFEVVDRF